MNCPLPNDQLNLYLDGALPDYEMEEVEEHLLRCESCGAQYDSLFAAVNAVRSLPRLKARGAVADRIEFLIEQGVDANDLNSEFSEEKSKSLGWLSWGGAVAAAVLLTAGAFAAQRYFNGNESDLSDKSRDSAFHTGGTKENPAEGDMEKNGGKLAKVSEEQIGRTTANPDRIKEVLEATSKSTDKSKSTGPELEESKKTPSDTKGGHDTKPNLASEDLILIVNTRDEVDTTLEAAKDELNQLVACLAQSDYELGRLARNNLERAPLAKAESEDRPVGTAIDPVNAAGKDENRKELELLGFYCRESLLKDCAALVANNLQAGVVQLVSSDGVWKAKTFKLDKSGDAESLKSKWEDVSPKLKDFLNEHGDVLEKDRDCAGKYLGHETAGGVKGDAKKPSQKELENYNLELAKRVKELKEKNGEKSLKGIVDVLEKESKTRDTNKKFESKDELKVLRNGDMLEIVREGKVLLRVRVVSMESLESWAGEGKK